MLLLSSNQKYPPFPLFSYFSVVVCLRCLSHHILSPIVYTFQENGELVFISTVQFMMSANSRIRFGLQIACVYLYIAPSHYHHFANFIWRHWSYKMPVRYDLSSVWVRLSIFSQLSIIQYLVLCVFSAPISFVMTEKIYTLFLVIIIKSEVWTITHCLGLGHEIMVCAVCLSTFLLVHIMAWRRPGDKPLFESMMVSLPTHICVTRPQWVNYNRLNALYTAMAVFCICVCCDKA